MHDYRILLRRGGLSTSFGFEQHVRLNAGRRMRKKVVFHEPPVENPQQTDMCKALREGKRQMSMAQFLDACRERTSEDACQARWRTRRSELTRNATSQRCEGLTSELLPNPPRCPDRLAG
jgi:hypothetical protein